MHDQGSFRNLEGHVKTKSGDLRLGLYSGEVIKIGSDRYILTVFNDITELRQFEKEMARLDRLNLIGEIAAGIAHEIRNPIVVRGFLQMLGGKKENASNEEFFKIMIEELDRANYIITEFLSLARSKGVDLREKSLNKILKDVFPLIQADAIKADKHVELELGKISKLLLNEKEIKQIILNLSRNGLEAMSPKGILTIKTYIGGEEVVFEVLLDQGQGIAPEVLNKIGTPFFTTKESGTGLGLAVCYSIAVRHKATIKIETGPTGTAFFVRFKT